MSIGFFFFLIGKNRRLKQAKEEAQAEIEQYRLQREKEFKTKEAAVRFIPFLFKDPFVSISVLLYLHGEILSKVVLECFCYDFKCLVIGCYNVLLL